jgi:hypothetical protein
MREKVCDKIKSLITMGWLDGMGKEWKEGDLCGRNI